MSEQERILSEATFIKCVQKRVQNEGSETEFLVDAAAKTKGLSASQVFIGRKMDTKPNESKAAAAAAEIINRVGSLFHVGGDDVAAGEL